MFSRNGWILFAVFILLMMIGRITYELCLLNGRSFLETITASYIPVLIVFFAVRNALKKT